jgi:hypothetical protein
MRHTRCHCLYTVACSCTQSDASSNAVHYDVYVYRAAAVDALEGLMITSVAMGLAHTLLIARDSEKDDKKVLEVLPAYPLKK